VNVSDVGLIGLACVPALIALAYWQEIAAFVRRLVGRDRPLYVHRPHMNSAELVMDRERRRREGAEAIRTHARRNR
jgi:hypothetical protein